MGHAYQLALTMPGMLCLATEAGLLFCSACQDASVSHTVDYLHPHTEAAKVFGLMCP